MLSRTADNLYWLSRYAERAEFVARILDAALRLAALPSSYGGGETNEWASALASAGDPDVFKPLYASVTEATVCDFLAFSPHNPSSIRSCIETARENARSVRTALTTEMWDAINGAWLELRNYEGRDLNRDEFTRFLDWVKGVSLAFDGSAYRTMLRNDAYWFSRLGVHLERADNTARLLDVKYHLLLPPGERVGGQLDYFQWTTLLREVSALTAYRWVYRESVRPWLVADLLVLNRQMPRSLASRVCRPRPQAKSSSLPRPAMAATSGSQRATHGEGSSASGPAPAIARAHHPLPGCSPASIRSASSFMTVLPHAPVTAGAGTSPIMASAVLPPSHGVF